MKIYLHNIIENTRVEGPGLRTAIWVQGCSIQCEGCMIPSTWAFTKQQSHNVEELATMLVTNKNIEGITILGGEPFDQAEAIATLIKQIREKSKLSIMLFTGYTKEYLEKNNPFYEEIISLVDILIEGPYIKSKTDFSREWIGSTNQKIHFLTDTYQHLKDKIYKNPNDHKIEIRLSKGGSVNINGMLPKEKLLQIISEIEKTKI